MMSFDARKKGLELSLEADPSLPVYRPEHFIIRNIYSDPNRFRQILINLIGNSLKFTTKGSISVRLLPESTEFLRCLVTDTGVGILREAGREHWGELHGRSGVNLQLQHSHQSAPGLDMLPAKRRSRRKICQRAQSPANHQQRLHHDKPPSGVASGPGEGGGTEGTAATVRPSPGG